MPAVFSQMGGGQFFGVLFFFLLFVAALTSSVSLMEVVVSFFIDEFNFSRTATTIVMSILMFILGIGASLSLGVWQEYKLFGKNFFDILDYVSSNLIMPFGGIMVAILVGWKSWTLVSEHFAAQGRNLWWLPLLKWFDRPEHRFLRAICSNEAQWYGICCFPVMSGKQNRSFLIFTKPMGIRSTSAS